MIVSFLHVGSDNTLPQIMVESVRAVTPDVTFLHMTDSATPVISGCERQEIPYDGERLMTYRMQHLSVPDQPMLILDTDVIVQKDLRYVFGRRFDVALTKRTGVIMYGGRNIAKLMPFNSGVMFSKCPAFWRECYKLCRNSPEDTQRWWGDQISIRLAAESGKYKILELPVGKYNYTPATAAEDVSMHYVVHYKGAGPRKQWMTDRWRSTPIPISS